MKSSRLALVAAISSALILTACGSSDSGGSDGSSSPEGDVTATDVATALAYVGGEEGKADSSLDPFTIGFVNGQGGVPAFPEQEKSADAAVKFINDKLGGVDGHPVKLEKCFIVAEEDGQKCAAQLLEADVKIANVGVVVFGNAPLYKLIGGKFPIINSVGSAEADSSTEHVYGLDGGALSTLYGVAVNASKQGKKVSLISSNNPAAKFLITKIITPFMVSIGLDVTTVYVADTATTPDFVSALQTSGAAKSDSVYLLPSTVASCVGLYDAMKQISLTKPVVTSSQCSTDPMPAKTGGGPEGWVISGLSDTPLISTPQADAFTHVMKSAGAEKFANQGFASKTFGDLLTTVKFAKTVGFDKLSAASLEEQILAFKGPAWMVPGALACGTNKVQIGVCGTQSSVFDYKGGKWNALEPFAPSS